MRFRHVRSNYAFENGRADKQRVFGGRLWRRAAQRKRWASQFIRISGEISWTHPPISISTLSLFRPQ